MLCIYAIVFAFAHFCFILLVAANNLGERFECLFEKPWMKKAVVGKKWLEFQLLNNKLL